MSPAASAVRLYERVREATAAAAPALGRVVPLRRAAASAAPAVDEPIFRPAFEDASPYAHVIAAPIEPPPRPAFVEDVPEPPRAPRPERTPIGTSTARAPRSPAVDARGWGAVAAARAEARAGARVSYRAVAAATVVLVVLAAVLVWVRLQVVAVGYQLSTGRQVEARLVQEQRELELEIAALTSPRRLEEIARDRLHMEPPAPGQIISEP